MRLGVIGHQGYEELPEILRTLFRLAPTLGIEAFLEQASIDSTTWRGKARVSRSPHSSTGW